MTRHTIVFFGPKLIKLQRDWLWHVLITFLSFEKGHVTSFEERPCTTELAIWHSGSRPKNNICSLFIVVCPGRPFMFSSYPLFLCRLCVKLFIRCATVVSSSSIIVCLSIVLLKGGFWPCQMGKKRFTFSFTCDNIWWKRGALFIDMQINSSKVLCKLTLQFAL